MSRSSRRNWWLSADGQMRRPAAAAAMVGEAMAIWNRRSRCQPAGLSPAARRMSPGIWSPGSAGLPVPGAGEVLLGQRARAGRGGAADAGHGDAVLAGDLGEEPAGDAGVGFQLPEVLARGDVLAVEELAGQDAAGVLPPLPCQGRGGPAPLPCGPGDAVQREPDVAGGGAQPRGGARRREACRVMMRRPTASRSMSSGSGPGRVRPAQQPGGGAQVSGSPMPRSCRRAAAWRCSASRSPVGRVPAKAW